MKFVKFAILCVLFSTLNLSCQTPAKPLYEISEVKNNIEKENNAIQNQVYIRFMEKIQLFHYGQKAKLSRL